MALLLLLAAAAPPSLADVPPVDRQAEHFYGAVAGPGPAVQVGWEASPAAAPAGTDISLTLVVRNAANPAELARPDLRTLPAFAGRFQVADEPAEPRAADAREVRFAYRVRPREEGEVEVPALPYRYFRPGFPEGKRMQTTYARPLKLAVAPAAPPPSAAVPLDAPDAFFRLDASPPLALPRFAWLAPLAAVPVVVGGWVAAWRAVAPDAARRAARVRSRAGRVALARLRGASDESTAAVARDYLASRFGLPATARTPGEIGESLRGLGHPDHADAAERFFRSADAARFAPASDTAPPLAERAAELIAAWEAAA